MKRANNRDRLLSLLSDREPHTQQEMLQAAGFRYGARLLELRSDGHSIVTERVGDDEFRYRLVRLAGEAVPVTDHHGQALLFTGEAA